MLLLRPGECRLGRPAALSGLRRRDYNRIVITSLLATLHCRLGGAVHISVSASTMITLFEEVMSSALAPCQQCGSAYGEQPGLTGTDTGVLIRLFQVHIERGQHKPVG